MSENILIDGSYFVLDSEAGDLKLWFEDGRDYRKKRMGMWIITDKDAKEIVDRGYSVVSHARYILKDMS